MQARSILVLRIDDGSIHIAVLQHVLLHNAIIHLLPKGGHLSAADDLPKWLLQLSPL